MNNNHKSPENLDFSLVISEHFNDLTKSEKRIANFLRKNQEESAFLPAGEIAKRLDLSEATLVRFARTLGFHQLSCNACRIAGKFSPQGDPFIQAARQAG